MFELAAKHVLPVTKEEPEAVILSPERVPAAMTSPPAIESVTNTASAYKPARKMSPAPTKPAVKTIPIPAFKIAAGKTVPVTSKPVGKTIPPFKSARKTLPATTNLAVKTIPSFKPAGKTVSSTTKPTVHAVAKTADKTLSGGTKLSAYHEPGAK